VPPIPCPDILHPLPLLNLLMTIRRWIFFLIALALGVGLGFLYATFVSPVQYVDNAPSTLRTDFRTDYTLMIAEVFKKDQNIDVAAQRLALLSGQPPIEVVKQAIAFAQQHGYTSADVALLQNLAAAMQNWQPSAGATP
jgi:hypothetical protein